MSVYHPPSLMPSPGWATVTAPWTQLYTQCSWGISRGLWQGFYPAVLHLKPLVGHHWHFPFLYATQENRNWPPNPPPSCRTRLNCRRRPRTPLTFSTQNTPGSTCLCCCPTRSIHWTIDTPTETSAIYCGLQDVWLLCVKTYRAKKINGISVNGA